MYSTDVVKNEFHITAIRSKLDPSEIEVLQNSIPNEFNLHKLKKNESMRLVIDKNSSKSRIVAYKLSTGSEEFIGYRISERDFHTLADNAPLNDLAYPKPPSARLSSSFNPVRINPVSGKIRPHNGIDYSMPMNTKIVSVIDGTITKAEYHKTMGNFVEVTGKSGMKTRYLHLNKILVRKNQRVEQGSQIALSGNSGRSSGPHLHYELLINDKPVDSLAFRPQSKKGSLDEHVYAHLRKYEQYFD